MTENASRFIAVAIREISKCSANACCDDEMEGSGVSPYLMAGLGDVTVYPQGTHPEGAAGWVSACLAGGRRRRSTKKGRFAPFSVQTGRDATTSNRFLSFRKGRSTTRYEAMDMTTVNSIEREKEAAWGKSSSGRKPSTQLARSIPKK